MITLDSGLLLATLYIQQNMQ